MVIAGALVLAFRRPFLDALTRTPARASWLIAVFFASGWIYALSERATIAPPS